MKHRGKIRRDKGVNVGYGDIGRYIGRKIIRPNPEKIVSDIEGVGNGLKLPEQCFDFITIQIILT